MNSHRRREWLTVRALLLHLLGRADECWYWLYQLALCHLHADPSAADATYEPRPGHPTTCGRSARPRSPRRRE